MSDNIGYAMLNEPARESLLWFNNPLSLLTWAHPVLEFVLLLGSVLAVWHAYSQYKKNSSYFYICAWLSIILHAIFWEIMVFNFEELDTFWHGEFSVMLYHNRLPFYIVFGYYPALFYHSLMLAERFGFAQFKRGIFVEALMVGLIFEILYVACESASPVLQFWKWNLEHMSSQPVWQNIPANGYLWGLSYGFAYALLNRYFFDHYAPRKNLGPLGIMGLLAVTAVSIPALAMVLLLPINILVYGFNALFAASAVIFVYFALAVWIFYLAPKRIQTKADKLLLVFPLLWLSFSAALYFYLYDDLLFQQQGSLYTQYSTPAGSLLLALCGLLGSAYLILKANLLGRKAA